MNMEQASKMDAVQVAIRVRPLNDRELKTNEGTAWQTTSNTMTQCTPDGRPISTSQYTFGINAQYISLQHNNLIELSDRIFISNARTNQLYNEFGRKIVNSTMEGMNGTIFCYGQTSSGKTHTMMGSDSEPGIIPMAIDDIFDYIDKQPQREFLLRVSFMEIYNEVISDLLNPEKDNLKIHERDGGDIYVGDLSEEVVCSQDEIMEFLASGSKNRKIGSTKMNERSSRSHTIFRLIVESREMGQGKPTPTNTENGTASSDRDRGSIDGAVRVAQLNLVDLAGSERVANTGAAGQRLKEGAHINKSLLSLGTVIGKLSEGVTPETGHIPYRDSKLTRILQNSLGGNARTGIVCTVTPASVHVDETISTLKFASRAKAIKNHATVNEVFDEQALIVKLRRQVRVLEEEKSQLEKGTKLRQLEEEKQEMASKIAQQRGQLDKITHMLLNSRPLLETAVQDERPSSSVQRSRRKTWAPGAKPRTRLSMAISSGLGLGLGGGASARAMPTSMSSSRRSILPSSELLSLKEAPATADDDVEGGAVDVSRRRRRPPTADMSNMTSSLSECDVLRAQLDKQKRTVKELEQALEGSNEAMIASISQHDAAKERVAELEQQLGRLEAELESEQVRAKQHEAALAASQKQVADLGENLEFMRHELEVFHNATPPVSPKQQQVQEADSDDVSNHEKEEKEDSSALKAVLLERDAEIAELTKRLAQLESEQEATIADIKTCAFEAAHAELEAQLAHMAESSTKAKEDMQQAVDECFQAQHQLKQTERKLADVMSELKGARGEQTTCEQGSQADILSMLEVEEMQEERDELTDRLDELEEQLVQANAQRDDAIKEAAEHVEAAAAAQQAHDAAMATLGDELEALRTERDDVMLAREQAEEEAQAKIAELEARIAQEKHDATEMEEARAAQCEALSTLEQELASLKATHEEEMAAVHAQHEASVASEQAALKQLADTQEKLNELQAANTALHVQHEERIAQQEEQITQRQERNMKQEERIAQQEAEHEQHVSLQQQHATCVAELEAARAEQESVLHTLASVGVAAVDALPAFLTQVMHTVTELQARADEASANADNADNADATADSVEIESLKQQFETQIDALKQELSEAHVALSEAKQASAERVGGLDMQLSILSHLVCEYKERIEELEGTCQQQHAELYSQQLEFADEMMALEATIASWTADDEEKQHVLTEQIEQLKSQLAELAHKQQNEKQEQEQAEEEEEEEEEEVQQQQQQQEQEADEHAEEQAEPSAKKGRFLSRILTPLLKKKKNKKKKLASKSSTMAMASPFSSSVAAAQSMLEQERVMELKTPLKKRVTSDDVMSDAEYDAADMCTPVRQQSTTESTTTTTATSACKLLMSPQVVAVAKRLARAEASVQTSPMHVRTFSVQGCQTETEEAEPTPTTNEVVLDVAADSDDDTQHHLEAAIALVQQTEELALLRVEVMQEADRAADLEEQLTRAADEQRSMHAAHQGALHVHEQTIVQLQSECEVSAAALDDALRKLSESSEHVGALESAQLQLAEREMALVEEAATLQSKLEEASQRTEELMHAMQAAEDKISQQQQQLEQHEAAAEAVQQQQQQQQDAKQLAMHACTQTEMEVVSQDELDEQVDKLLEVDGELSRTQRTLEAVREDLSAVTQAHVLAQSQRDELQQALDALQGSDAERSAHVQSMQCKLEEAQQAAQQLEEQLACMHQQYAAASEAASEQLHAMTSQTEQLTEELAAARTCAQEAADAAEGAEAARGVMQSRVEEMQVEVVKAQEELAQANAKLEEMTSAHVEDLERLHEQLSSSSKQHDQRIAHYETRLRELEQTQAMTQSHAEEIQAMTQSHAAEVQCMQQQLEERQAVISKLMLDKEQQQGELVMENELLSEQLAQLQARATQLEADNKRASAELAQLAETHKAATLGLEQEIASLNKSARAHAEQLAIAQEDKHNLEQAQSKTLASLEAVQSELTAAEERASKLYESTTKLKQFKSKYDRLNKMVLEGDDYNERKIAELQLKIEELEQRSSSTRGVGGADVSISGHPELMSRIKDVEDEYREQMEEHRKLKQAELDALKTQVEDSESYSEHLKQQLEAARDTANELEARVAEMRRVAQDHDIIKNTNMTLKEENQRLKDEMTLLKMTPAEHKPAPILKEASRVQAQSKAVTSLPHDQQETASSATCAPAKRSPRLRPLADMSNQSSPCGGPAPKRPLSMRASVQTPSSSLFKNKAEHEHDNSENENQAAGVQDKHQHQHQHDQRAVTFAPSVTNEVEAGQKLAALANKRQQQAYAPVDDGASECNTQ